MAFCSNCGNQVTDRDRYCGICGTAQPLAGPAGAGRPGGARAGSPYSSAPAHSQDPLAGISPRLASVLCYIPVVGWIPAVIVLATQRFRNELTVRFHAFQGLYLFAVWLMLQWVLKPIFENVPGPVRHLDNLLGVFLVGIWIFMIIKANQDEAYELPIIGELAHRSAAER